MLKEDYEFFDFEHQHLKGQRSSRLTSMFRQLIRTCFSDQCTCLAASDGSSVNEQKYKVEQQNLVFEIM